MSDSRYTDMSRDRVISLERLEDRIFHAMLSVRIPDLSIDEIVTLRNGVFLERPAAKKDPKQIVIGWCEAEKNRIIESWDFERCYFKDDPEECPPDSPPDTSPHDEFIARMRSWTMLEALKIVRIFEGIDALALTALRLTPETIYRLLEDTRANPV